MIKRCPKCREDLLMDAFGVDRRRKDGLGCWCRACMRDNTRRQRETEHGMAKHRAREKARYAKEPERIRARNAQWQKKNAARYRVTAAAAQERRMTCPAYRLWINTRTAAWARQDASRWAYKNAQRRAAKRRAVPAWLTDGHRAEIKVLYREAARLTRETGIEHHVDHIMPLRAKTVWGLHVPWNLRVVTADFNLRRRNFLPDPSEWLAYAEAA